MTSAQRDPILPDVPTIAELGYPGYETSYWIGLLGPARDAARQSRPSWRKVFIQAVNDPEVKQKLDAQTIHPHALPAKDLEALIHKEIEKWAAVIKDSNIDKQ